MKKITDIIKKAVKVVSNLVDTEGVSFARFVGFKERKKETKRPTPNIDSFMQAHSRLVQTGVHTKATVLDIDDSGKMVNFNPIVRLTLRLDADNHPIITPEAIVSLLQLPQIQQQITIAYLPEMPHLVAII